MADPHTPGGDRSLVVVIPTYNERDNLLPIVDRLRAAVPTAHALVVDDASPDAPESWPTRWPPRIPGCG